MKKKLLKNVDLNWLRYSNTKNLSVFFGDSIAHSSNSFSIFRHQKTSNLHIINPELSLLTLYQALMFLSKLCQKQKRPLKVLFLNTNPEFCNFVKDIAKSTGQHYINSKWVGGTFTNWKQVSKSIVAYQVLNAKWKKVLTDTDFRWPKLEKLKKCFDGYFNHLISNNLYQTVGNKNLKEVFYKKPNELFFSVEDKYSVNNHNPGKKRNQDIFIKRSNLLTIFGDEKARKSEKKENQLGSISSFFEKKNLNKQKFHYLNRPDILVVVDVSQNLAAIEEANLQNIPVIGFVRSSTNTNNIDFPIVGNNQNPEFLHFCLNWIGAIIRKFSKKI